MSPGFLSLRFARVNLSYTILREVVQLILASTATGSIQQGMFRYSIEYIPEIFKFDRQNNILN